MAEETNEDVLAKAKAWHDDMLSVVPDAYGYEIPVPLMAALIAELGTVRGERDALRLDIGASLRSIKDTAETAQGEWSSVSEVYAPEWTHPYKEIISEVDEAAALNTQPAPPQAEWTPRIDDKVRTAWSGAICTVVNTRDNRSLIVSESGIEGWINNSDLAPVDESEV